MPISIWQAVQNRTHKKGLWIIFLIKAFGGSPVQLASTLFGSEKLTKTEFENLRNEILALQKEENEDGDNKAY